MEKDLLEWFDEHIDVLSRGDVQEWLESKDLDVDQLIMCMTRMTGATIKGDLPLERMLPAYGLAMFKFGYQLCDDNNVDIMNKLIEGG